MATLAKSKRLKKELTLLNVYAIATGTTLSAGFFLLPGLAASEAGPAVILAECKRLIGKDCPDFVENMIEKTRSSLNKAVAPVLGVLLFLEKIFLSRKYHGREAVEFH